MYPKNRKWGKIIAYDENHKNPKIHLLNEKERLANKLPKMKRRNMRITYSLYLNQRDQRSYKANNSNDDSPSVIDSINSINSTINNDISFNDQNDTENDQDIIDMIPDSELNIDFLQFNSNMEFDDQLYDPGF
ncbi:hypothetical protein M9Y10_028438 [Tritrichomonas musculus]|uniref:Uncharacterized protein n=1 Tax=Tritrichomonas musculus TaxID=1915356 RepID=A0ABR2KKF1_9EUKA